MRRERGAHRDKKNGRAGTTPPRKKSALREWIDALVFAAVVMLVVRTFFFDLYKIPTPSMEKTLMVGDYLVVSKLHYGTRTPMSIGIPFTPIYIKGLALPWTRLPGFSEVKRGDAMVFNYPVDQAIIERKTHYIKRVVGLPGDTLAVRDKIVYINGQALPKTEGMQQRWLVYKTSPDVRLSRSSLKQLGIDPDEAVDSPVSNIAYINATEEAARQVEAWSWVERVEPAIVRDPSVYQGENQLYPPDRGYTADNYGPIHIPAGGETITLTAENWPVYETVIRRYEGHTTAVRNDGTFLIDGQEQRTYTFAQAYFLAMGDNRDNSQDSRFWGFVPMDHVVGKAILIYFSWEKEEGQLLGIPRFGRLFNLIH